MDMTTANPDSYMSNTVQIIRMHCADLEAELEAITEFADALAWLASATDKPLGGALHRLASEIRAHADVAADYLETVQFAAMHGLTEGRIPLAPRTAQIEGMTPSKADSGS